MKTKYSLLTANQAVAQIAYKTNEVIPIYPITPASEMSELVEQWSAENRFNNFNSIPTTYEMQSEAGVAGAMHGALQTGSLSTTFTASQGLLLMLPNMYKIAGELTPNVIHVATRSLATHALSVFGDHSDIMACRQSGYAFLGSASVQEAHDMALISQAATLESRIPFVHFFDGFRTSHEINTIESISDKVINEMIDENKINDHKIRALNPDAPVIRGTSQGSDVFFQSREAVNTFYNACPSIVQDKMNVFEKLTGRGYKLFDYVGDENAERIIISMASSTETIETTINELNKNGEKLGLVKVRLFRPFSTKHLIEALPKTVKSIAVLDRTKEPGSSGEPLYLDIVKSISESFQTKEIENFPRIIGGRYGLSSKEFTPNMVQAIYNNLKQVQPKNNFTIGIQDDITHLSLDYSEIVPLKNKYYQGLFYQEKCKIISDSFEKTIQLLHNLDNTYIQGYAECDYKKSNSRNVSHIRIGNQPIKAPYLVLNANFSACENPLLLENDNILDTLIFKGTLLVNTALSPELFWKSLPLKVQKKISEKSINLLVVNGEELKKMGELKINTIYYLHACFLALQKNSIFNQVNNFIFKVDTSGGYKTEEIELEDDKYFSTTVLGRLLENKGNDLPVSLMPVDGTYSSDTSKFNRLQKGNQLPIWDAKLCVQCGACSMACPQGSLRIKAYDNSYLSEVPDSFNHVISEEFDLMNFTIQNNPDQCNGCNNCIDACTVNALIMKDKSQVIEKEKQNWNYFETIPEMDKEKIDVSVVSQQQLQEPLFKYSIGVEGCGEAPYLKLISQLFGDRMLVANATGASSIFGGALPTTPWSKNSKGQGPSWSNSLFEDNAEFGFGYRLSLNQQEKQARILLKKLRNELDTKIVDALINAKQETEKQINEQRFRVENLKIQLKALNIPEADRLMEVIDVLVKKSIWIVGGDGWAYDIGYGGLDHVIASGENVNILVLDNEVYDNTGSQASKSTPYGAEAKFAFGGKQKQKKDLGKLVMTYDNVYVASVAIGANQEQTLKAFNEAESYDGPSIIIAYCHSSAHGIDMKNPSQYHKAAVDSGQWLLYRNDPRKIHSFQLDSQKPIIEIDEYLKLEKRFEKMLNRESIEINSEINKRQNFIDTRFSKFECLTGYE